MSSADFQLLSPHSLRSSRSHLRPSCEIELLNTSWQTKQRSTSLPTDWGTGAVTVTTHPCQSLISSVTAGEETNLPSLKVQGSGGRSRREVGGGRRRRKFGTSQNSLQSTNVSPLTFLIVGMFGNKIPVLYRR